MRNSEARNLKCEDVNLEAGKLIIRGSKAHKERIVMLHSDIQQLLIEYEKRVDILRSNRGYFFPNDYYALKDLLIRNFCILNSH